MFALTCHKTKPKTTWHVGPLEVDLLSAKNEQKPTRPTVRHYHEGIIGVDIWIWLVGLDLLRLDPLSLDPLLSNQDP